MKLLGVGGVGVPVMSLTQTGGSLAPKVHRVQTHGALGCSHVESHCEAVRGGVVHPLPLPLTVLKTPAVL